MLLGDQTREFGKKMGVYNEKSGTLKRSVFLVGPDGKIQYINYNYSVTDDKDFTALKQYLAGR
jgi:alkyl hydroperoxide reductase subunit AhpC